MSRIFVQKCRSGELYTRYTQAHKHTFTHKVKVPKRGQWGTRLNSLERALNAKLTAWVLSHKQGEDIKVFNTNILK